MFCLYCSPVYVWFWGRLQSWCDLEGGYDSGLVQISLQHYYSQTGNKVEPSEIGWHPNQAPPVLHEGSNNLLPCIMWSTPKQQEVRVILVATVLKDLSIILIDSDTGYLWTPARCYVFHPTQRSIPSQSVHGATSVFDVSLVIEKDRERSRCHTSMCHSRVRPHRIPCVPCNQLLLKLFQYYQRLLLVLPVVCYCCISSCVVLLCFQ